MLGKRGVTEPTSSFLSCRASLLRRPLLPHHVFLPCHEPPPLSSTKVAASYSLGPPTAAQASSLAVPTSSFLPCRVSLLCRPLLPHHVFLPCHVVVRRCVLHHCRDLQFSLSLSLSLSLSPCLVGDGSSQIAGVDCDETFSPVVKPATIRTVLTITFVREKVARGQARVLHVPSRHQIADIFTKGLSRVLFDDFRTNLSVREPPASTAGV